MKVLIFRGLPGAGKTYYQKKYFPDAEVVGADHYFMVDGEYRFDSSRIEEAHHHCFLTFLNCVKKKPELIIVDNTNMSAWEMAPYVLAGRAFGADVEIWNFYIHVEKALERNIHGVPEHTVRSMAKRMSKHDMPPFWPQRSAPIAPHDYVAKGGNS